MANNNDNKVLNVPPLRFPEFGLPFISVMDILADGTINYDSIRGKVEATEREIENFSVEKGDILFLRSSETLEDVGRANVYMDNRTAVYGGFVIRGRKIGDYNPLFFKYLLSTPLARKRTCRMGAGAQHFNIGQDGLSKISLCFPLMEEQNKIARLLSLIDERIATQNKIIEKLQSLIKGIAQNVARNNKPNIRLSECLECSSSTLQELRVCCMQRNGSNNVYLSEIAQIYQPQTISSAELTEDGFLVYGANGIIGKYKDYNHKNRTNLYNLSWKYLWHGELYQANVLDNWKCNGDKYR